MLVGGYGITSVQIVGICIAMAVFQALLVRGVKKHIVDDVSSDDNHTALEGLLFCRRDTSPRQQNYQSGLSVVTLV